MGNVEQSAMSKTAGVRRILATFGNGDYGRLGLGDAMKSVEIPTQVSGNLLGTSILQVSCGGAHTLVVGGDGTVFSFGLNDRGQLGHSGGAHFVSHPKEVNIPEPVILVSAGHYHSLAVTETGNLWSWGDNGSGQLGRRDAGGEASQDPRIVRSLQDSKVSQVSAGAAHSLAVTREGEVYSWGEGSSGRLGHGAPKSSFFDMFSHQSEHEPRKIRSLETLKIEKVSAGHMHSACVDSEGRLFVFGNGRHLQLGTGRADDATKPTAIRLPGSIWDVSCGGLHTMSTLHTGQTFVWGADQNGCLGLGSSARHAKKLPTLIPKLASHAVSTGWKHSAAISMDGDLHTWGWGGSQGGCSRCLSSALRD